MAKLNLKRKQRTKPALKPRGGARKGSGPKELVPSREQRRNVEIFKASGFTNEEIAHCIGPEGISVSSLLKHFAHELRAGKPRVDGIAVGKLQERIKRGDQRAIEFYLKTRRPQDFSQNPVDEAGADRLAELTESFKAGPARRALTAVSDSRVQ